MMNSQDFKSLEELDATYAAHLDSLLTGGFLTKDSPEYADFMGAWAEAVKDYTTPKDYTSL